MDIPGRGMVIVKGLEGKGFGGEKPPIRAMPGKRDNQEWESG